MILCPAVFFLRGILYDKGTGDRMRYTTKDLSGILGVSGNTIRRYDEMGYIKGRRNEENGYREFLSEDVEKLMYVTKYRKEDLSHEEIQRLLKSPPEDILAALEKKREEIQDTLKYYMAIDHLLKDDLMLMKRAGENMGRMLRQDCQPMHFIRYIDRGKLVMDKKRTGLLAGFMNTCPEFYYMYLYEKEDVENGSVLRSSGIGANIIMTEKYGYAPVDGVELYEVRPCVLRFVKTPVEDDNTDLSIAGSSWYEMFGRVFDYMKKESLCLAGDVMVLKIGSFYENDRLMQYQLFHFPVEQEAGL